MKLADRLSKILVEYRDRLREILGEELEAVILYGSRARGGGEEGWDIDLLCVTKGPFECRLRSQVTKIIGSGVRRSS